MTDKKVRKGSSIPEPKRFHAEENVFGYRMMGGRAPFSQTPARVRTNKTKQNTHRMQCAQPDYMGFHTEATPLQEANTGGTIGRAFRVQGAH